MHVIKTRSSAKVINLIDLMTDFITQQQVDKEKQRQERQNVHNDKKTMHKEKMNLFRDLLKEMKD